MKIRGTQKFNFKLKFVLRNKHKEKVFSTSEGLTTKPLHETQNNQSLTHECMCVCREREYKYICLHTERLLLFKITRFFLNMMSFFLHTSFSISTTTYHYYKKDCFLNSHSPLFTLRPHSISLIILSLGKPSLNSRKSN
jgi:hypothetical protein